jgi:hypothetical protein
LIDIATLVGPRWANAVYDSLEEEGEMTDLVLFSVLGDIANLVKIGGCLVTALSSGKSNTEKVKDALKCAAKETVGVV